MSYVRPVVKIELGARSDDWPHQEKPIQPYLAEVFPQLAMGATFPARVLAAERTFWEKALLLHEETFRPADKPRKIRMARHYYDIRTSHHARRKRHRQFDSRGFRNVRA